MPGTLIVMDERARLIRVGEKSFSAETIEHVETESDGPAELGSWLMAAGIGLTAAIVRDVAKSGFKPSQIAWGLGALVLLIGGGFRAKYGERRVLVYLKGRGPVVVASYRQWTSDERKAAREQSEALEYSLLCCMEQQIKVDQASSNSPGKRSHVPM